MSTENTFKNIHRVRAEIEVSLTEEDIDDIMGAALDGGITYWCCKAEVVGEYLGEYASDQISRGGALKLYDSEEDEVYELTLDKFLTGVKKYLENSCHLAIEDGEIDTCDLDAGDADCIVQFALFGEEVYG